MQAEQPNPSPTQSPEGPAGVSDVAQQLNAAAASTVAGVPTSEPAAQPAADPVLPATNQQQADEDHLRLIDYFTKKRTQLLNGQLMQAPCASCGGGDFKIGKEPSALLAQNGGSSQVITLPIVSLVCGHCGAVQLFAKNYVQQLMQ